MIDVLLAIIVVGAVIVALAIDLGAAWGFVKRTWEARR
jgi:hypothetical protein